MPSNNVFDFITDIVPTVGLIEGVHLEVSSFYVLNLEDLSIQSIDGFYNIDSLDWIRHDPLKNGILDFLIIKLKGITNDPIVTFHSTTFFPHPSLYLYKIEGRIDLDTAISLGLGVVKMKKGPYKGDFLLYNTRVMFSPENEVEERDENSYLDDLILLKVYLQLTENDRFNEPNLVEILVKYLEISPLLLISDIDTLLARIHYSIDKNKGELLLLPDKDKKY